MKFWIFSILYIFSIQDALSIEKIKNVKNDEVNIEFFNQVKNFVSTYHVDDFNEEEFIFNALNGGISGLDPHSQFISPKHYDQFYNKVNGEFYGVGIQIISDNGFVKVVNPINGSPAFKAGIKSGDYITHVNDENIYKNSLDIASQKIQGKKGTTVKLTVLRAGESKPLYFKIQRQAIKDKPISSKLIGDILLIKINNFTKDTSKDFKKEIQDHKSVKGVIIDLRDNLGGQFNQAIIIADYLLPAKKVIIKSVSRFKSEVETQNKKIELYCRKKNDCETIFVTQTSNEVIFIAKEQTIIKPEVPVVVLINETSASASEVLSAALQDNKRAIIIGENSFGKGVIQRVIPLNKGKLGAIKLTTSQYYTPNNNPVQTLGINPDIVVKTGLIKPFNNEFKELFFEKEKDLKNHTLAKNLNNIAQESKNHKEIEGYLEYYQDAQLFVAINTINSALLFKR